MATRKKLLIKAFRELGSAMLAGEIGKLATCVADDNNDARKVAYLFESYNIRLSLEDSKLLSDMPVSWEFLFAVSALHKRSEELHELYKGLQGILEGDFELTTADADLLFHANLEDMALELASVGSAVVHYFKPNVDAFMLFNHCTTNQPDEFVQAAIQGITPTGIITWNFLGKLAYTLSTELCNEFLLELRLLKENFVLEGELPEDKKIHSLMVARELAAKEDDRS